MKALFQSKISVKQIKNIEKNLIEKLYQFDQNFESVYSENLTEITNIYFPINPQGISIMREIKNEKAYRKLKKTFNQVININGIEFYNKKTKKFENIPCSFSNFQLTFIQYGNPEKFHKTFEINKIQLNNLKIKTFPISNPDKEIAEKILQNVTQIEKAKLDLEYCFEIEFENKKYYTILDFEDGNYVAIDKQSNVYYLNHNAEIRIRKINEEISEFLTQYNGNKLELEKKLE